MILFSSVNIVNAQEIVNTQESILTDLSYSYLDTLVSLAKKNYPQVRIAALNVKVAKTNVHKANVGWLDAFTLSYYYIPGNNNALNPNNTFFFNGYQVGVNLNIGTLLQNPFNSRAAKEEYKIAQYNQDEYALNIEAEVKKLYFTYIQQQALLRLRTKSTSDASVIANSMQHKFETGVVTYADYTKAISVETEQNQYLIMAQSDVLIAKTSLEEIIGTKLENIH
jgi:outer membrane protein TolC